MYRPLTDWWKEKVNALSDKTGGILGNGSPRLENVVLSKRLVESPCVVVSSQWGHSAKQERVMKGQAFGQQDMMMMMAGMKTLEINPNHPVIVDLLNRVKDDKDDEQAVSTASVLFQAALLDSGYEISDPSALVSKIYNLMSVQLGVDPQALVKEVEVPEGEVEEEKGDEEEVDFGSESFEDIDWGDEEKDHDEL
jgi:HSP90 family molecular chaperone